MKAPPPLVLRHARARNLASAVLCLALAGWFGARAAAGAADADLLLVPALLLFGGYGALALVRALDRRPLAILDESGLHLPDQLARPLPWQALVEVQERRFGRTRLLLYVDDLAPYRRADRPAGWTVDAVLGKLLPGFERPRLVLETAGLDHGHATIRAALQAFWGAARYRQRCPV